MIHMGKFEVVNSSFGAIHSNLFCDTLISDGNTFAVWRMKRISDRCKMQVIFRAIHVTSHMKS